MRCSAVSHGEAKVEPITLRDDSGQVWKLFELCPKLLQDIRVSERMIVGHEE